MQVYTRYRAAAQRSQHRANRGWIFFVFIAALAGIVWLGWKRNWWKHPTLSTNFSQTNTLLAVGDRAPVATSTGRITLTRTQAVSISTTPATNLPSAKQNLTAVLDAQVALDRLAISPGSIDGVFGSQTRAAIRAFQSREGLPPTGELDAATTARLLPAATPSLTSYRVEAGDMARLYPLATTWLGKSQQERLDYESVLEMAAERSHSHPGLIRKLNNAMEWSAVQSGTEIAVPATEREAPRSKAALIRIRLGQRILQAFDATNGLLAHFPCSIAQRVEKRPVGDLRVSVVVPNPDYMFNPENFPESAEAQELGRKLRINPGPNNPVGTAWIGLSLPGYGIHGTPKPEDVGRTESHGCFRLANWNAEYLLQLVTVGTPVQVEP